LPDHHLNHAALMRRFSFENELGYCHMA